MGEDSYGEAYCRRDRWSRWRSTIAPTARNATLLGAGIFIRYGMAPVPYLVGKYQGEAAMGSCTDRNRTDQ